MSSYKSVIVGLGAMGMGAAHSSIRAGLDKDLNDGVVRCSMAHYNTAEEVDCLIYAIDHIL